MADQNSAGDLFEGPNTTALTNALYTTGTQQQDFYRQLALLQQQYQEQLQKQNALGHQLDQQIAGTTPSVAGTQLQRGVGEIGAATRASAAGAGGNNAALANYGSIQAMGAAQAKANQDAAQLRAQETAQAEQAKAQLLAGQQAATQGQYATTTGAATTTGGQGISGAGTLAGVNQQEVGSERNLAGNLIQGGGSALTALSDEDEKEDMSKVGGSQMDDFLDHIAGFSFKYKDPKKDGAGPGNRVGVKAQDVAKTPLGKSMVIKGKPMKLDMRNALGAALAGLAHVNQKIDKMGARA